MRAPEEILLKPILTEKILKLQEAQRAFGFQIHPKANKLDVKRAVETRFKVGVEEVRIIRVKGKSKRLGTRRGLSRGRRSDWKKAIVRLKEGYTIDYIEGTKP